tara:strand:+ start:2072 stop:4090 length:2019 start_codon:yes stop_codon:yes gene_type:complete
MSCGGGLTSGKANALGGMLMGTGMGTEKINGLVSTIKAQPMVAAAESALDAVAAQYALDIPIDYFASDEAGLINIDITKISDNVAATVASLGGGAAAALVGKPPSGFGSLGSSLMNSVTQAANKFFPNGDISSFTQIFNQGLSFVETSLESMTSMAAMLATDFGASIEDAVKDFNVGGFLGDNITTFDNLITNGLSSLTSGSLADLGTSFLKMGDFGNLSDLANLGVPGQIVGQIIQGGAGDIGGILAKVTTANIPFSELLNPEHQESLLNILDSVTGIKDVSDMLEVFDSTLSLDTLGDLTRLEKLIPADLNLAAFDDFGGLVNILRSADLGNMQSLGEFGNVLTSLNQTEFLELVQAQTQLVDPQAASVIQSFFSGGTGPFNSILLQDIMGTVGGYTHDVSIPIVSAAMTIIDDTGITADLKAMYSELSIGSTGGYTTSNPAIEDAAVTKAITDPRTNIEYTVMDEFIIDKVAQINAETSVVLADPTVAEQMAIMNVEWLQIAEQVAGEQAVFSKTNINLEAITPNDTGSLFSFADRLHEFGLDELNANDFINRMATSDLYGEFVQYGLLEGQNFDQLSDVGTVKIIAEAIVDITAPTPTVGIQITANSTDEYNWTGYPGTILTSVAESAGPAIFDFTGLVGTVTSEVDLVAGATATFNYTGLAGTVTVA